MDSSSSSQSIKSEDYNSFTYQLKVQKSFEAYRAVLYEAAATGQKQKVKGSQALKQTHKKLLRIEAFSNSHALSYYTGTTASNPQCMHRLQTSNNIIKFTNLSGAVLSNIIKSGAKISFTYNGFANVYSEILSVDNASNTAFT
jgi:zona occludens toxin (predicted ATPase)